MALTQSQLISQIAEDTELTKNDVKNVLTSLEEVVLSQIGSAE